MDETEAERHALETAYQQGLNGKRRDWLHNLGDAFERKLHAAYARGKAEKVRRAAAAMKSR